MLTDAALGAELCPDAPHVGAFLAHTMPPGKRAIYERMVTFGNEWNAFAAGEGPCPDLTGVIVDAA